MSQETAADPPDPNASLDDHLAHHGIGPTAWDAVLVGDGSGSGWHQACGFACAVVQKARAAHPPVILTGAMSAGTSQLMELTPYLWGLYWFAANGGNDLRAALGRPVRVHVISDNLNIVKQGRGEHRAKKMAPLWASIHEFSRAGGFHLGWHWAGRDRLALNALTDHLSRECRLLMEESGRAAALLPDVDLRFLNPRRQLLTCPPPSTTSSPTSPETSTPSA